MFTKICEVSVGGENKPASMPGSSSQHIYKIVKSPDSANEKIKCSPRHLPIRLFNSSFNPGGSQRVSLIFILEHLGFQINFVFQSKHLIQFLRIEIRQGLQGHSGRGVNV